MRIPFHTFTPILVSKHNFDSFSIVSHKNYQLVLLYFNIYNTKLVQVSSDEFLIIL